MVAKLFSRLHVIYFPKFSIPPFSCTLYPGVGQLLSLPSLRTEFIECDANGELKWKETEVASDLACSSANTICKF